MLKTTNVHKFLDFILWNGGTLVVFYYAYMNARWIQTELIANIQLSNQKKEQSLTFFRFGTLLT